MTSAENITAWFTDAAARHPDIRHTSAAPRFFEMEWDEIVQSGGMVALPAWALVLEDHEEALEYNEGDYTSRRSSIAYMVLRTVPVGDKPHKKTTYNEAQRIAEQVLAKLVNDAEQEYCDADVPPGVHPPVKVLISSVRATRVGPVPAFDHAFGYRIAVDIRTDHEVDMDPNNANWLTQQ